MMQMLQHWFSMPVAVIGSTGICAHLIVDTPNNNKDQVAAA